jgi:hypothetical protein
MLPFFLTERQNYLVDLDICNIIIIIILFR